MLEVRARRTESSGSLERALPLLRRHVSEINASVIVQHALRAARQRSAGKEPDGPLFVFELLQSASMFLAPASRESLERELAALFPGELAVRSVVKKCTVAVHSEGDLKLTRNAAREVCDHVGARGFGAQKILTAVSEIARNVAKYAGRGEVHFLADRSRGEIIVEAEDRGPGIPNLEQILAGKYQSKTGMGRGILGVQKLADHFEIHSSPLGTRVKLVFSNV